MLGPLHNLSGFKIADRYLLWPVPKLKIDLSRRNASTQGRNTDLVERYQHICYCFLCKTVILLRHQASIGAGKIYCNIIPLVFFSIEFKVIVN
jgi:hypothetical protein